VSAEENKAFRRQAHLRGLTVASIQSALSSDGPEPRDGEVDGNGHTALSHAMDSSGHHNSEALACAKLLIEFCDPNVQAGMKKRNALALAFESGKWDCAEFLAPKTDLSQTDAYGLSALAIGLAAWAGHHHSRGEPIAAPEHFNALKFIARANEPTKEQWAELATLAVGQADLEFLKEAATHCELSAIKATQGDWMRIGEPLLMGAASLGLPEITAFLIERGCPLNERSGGMQATPLIGAIIGRGGLLGSTEKPGHAECLTALLAAGADSSWKTAQGETPLMLAASGCRIQCASALLAACDPDEQDSAGRTALMHAVNRAKSINREVDEYREQLKLVGILAKRTNLSARSSGGKTALDMAIAHRIPELIDEVMGAMEPKAIQEALSAMHAAMFPKAARIAEAGQLEEAIEQARGARPSGGASRADISFGPDAEGRESIEAAAGTEGNRVASRGRI